MALLRDPAAPPLPDWLLDDLVRRAPTGPDGTHDCAISPASSPTCWSAASAR